MYYLLFTFIALITFGVIFWIKKRKQQRFKLFVDLDVRVLLDQNNVDVNRQYGCVIFQLQCKDLRLKEVVLTSVQSTNKHFHINNVERLNFFIVPGKIGESAMRSVGLYTSNHFIASYQIKKEGMVIKGYVKDKFGKKHDFMKTSYFRLEFLNQEMMQSMDIKSSSLAL